MRSRIKNQIIISVIFLLSYICLYAQDADSTWDLRDLEFDDLEFTHDDFSIYKSTGWFPKPYTGYYNISIFYKTGTTWDFADNIYSNSFENVGLPFSDDTPANEEDRRIKKSFSNEYEDDYPIPFFHDAGFEFKLGLPLPAMLYMNVDAVFMQGMLFNQDDKKSFLDRDGSKKDFVEFGIVSLYEFGINYGAGILLPLYGAYLSDNDQFTISSVYYLRCGLSGYYSLYHRANQYLQIANNKDRLRYGNGLDTVSLLKDVELENNNKYRQYIDLGFGVDFEVENFGFFFEFDYSFHLNEVLQGIRWKQNLVGMKIGIYISKFF